MTYRMIVDNFAGGGGASTGIEMALERRPISKTDQVAKCGNSVPPPMARALVAANCGDLAVMREAAE